MTTIAVLGYASLDHAMRIDPFRGADATTHIRERVSADWPSPGGIANLARAAAAGGCDVVAVSWLADDELGRAWSGALAADDVRDEGVRVSGTLSPHSYLLYEPEGATYCLFNPGDSHHDELTERQRDVLRSADWALVAVGPAAATRELLELGAGTRVAWSVKHDADALPADLVRRLLGTADVITFNRAEEALIAGAAGAGWDGHCRPTTLLVRTAGADGVEAWYPGESVLHVPARRLESVDDTTGAGDTFAGRLVAELAAREIRGRADECTLQDALRAAADAAANLIAGRSRDAAPAGKEQI